MTRARDLADSADKDIAGTLTLDDLTVGGTAYVTGDLTVDTDTLYVDTTGNRVGIGTTGPNTKLHIGGAPDNRVITFDQSGRASHIGTYFSSGADDSRIDFFISDGNTDGSSNNRMSIKGNGNIGIGTTSPPFLTTISSTANAYSSYNVDVSNLQLAIQNPTNATGSGVGLGFSLSDNTDNIGAAIVHTRTDSESVGNLHFATKSANTAGADLPVRMTLNSDGQLGIGISPVANLQVHKDNTRIALSANTANLAAQHRIEFWEGQATATATSANMAIEYDGRAINASDGALLIKGSGSSPLSGNDYTFAAFNRNGSFLLPHQPGFMAYAQPSRNGSYYLYGYQNVLYNNGSYYNNTNGRFTAPVDGVYEFIGSTVWDTSTLNMNNILYLAVNGVTNVGANFGARAQNTVIGHLPLSAGDYVNLRSDIAPYASTPRNWFMGRLLG